MKQTLQSLKNRQGFQFRFQFRLKNIGIKNAKLQKQRYTLSNFVFVSNYNKQYENNGTWRLSILSDFDDDKDAVHLADLTFAGKEYPTILRRCVHTRKTSRSTLRLFMVKSASEEYASRYVSLKGKHEKENPI